MAGFSQNSTLRCVPCNRFFKTAAALQQHCNDSPMHANADADAGSSHYETDSHNGVSLSSCNTTSTVDGSNTEGSPLDDFFLSFADLKIDFNANTNPAKAFKKLTNKLGYSPKAAFNEALVSEWEVHFGAGHLGAKAWQRLCKLVGIESPGGSVTQCKKELRFVHVNLVDLVMAARSGSKPKTFKNVGQLSAYTANSGKFFPKDKAKSSTTLKSMLRILT